MAAKSLIRDVITFIPLVTWAPAFVTFGVLTSVAHLWWAPLGLVASIIWMFAAWYRLGRNAEGR